MGAHAKYWQRSAVHFCVSMTLSAMEMMRNTFARYTFPAIDPSGWTWTCDSGQPAGLSMTPQGSLKDAVQVCVCSTPAYTVSCTTSVVAQSNSVSEIPEWLRLGLKIPARKGVLRIDTSNSE